MLVDVVSRRRERHCSGAAPSACLYRNVRKRNRQYHDRLFANATLFYSDLGTDTRYIILKLNSAK